MILEQIASVARRLAEMPTPLVIAILAGVLLRRRHPGLGTALVLTASLLLYALSTPLVGATLLRSLEEAGHEGPLAGGAPGAIIILSAGIRGDGATGYEVDALTLERLRQGARLHRKTGLPILVSGGVLRDGQPSMASIMAKSLIEDFGIASAWQENTSRTTRENALHSAQQLIQRSIHSAYLVTHAWHMPRARTVFERAGLSVRASSTGFTLPPAPERPSNYLPSVNGLQGSRYALHEWIGSVWYWLNGDSWIAD